MIYASSDLSSLNDISKYPGKNTHTISLSHTHTLPSPLSLTHTHTHKHTHTRVVAGGNYLYVEMISSVCGELEGVIVDVCGMCLGDASAVADGRRGVRCATFHPRGHHLATGDRTGNIR